LVITVVLTVLSSLVALTPADRIDALNRDIRVRLGLDLSGGSQVLLPRIAALRTWPNVWIMPIMRTAMVRRIRAGSTSARRLPPFGRTARRDNPLMPSR
jgi:hypothetical protein